jgi:hypothetical protein
MPQHVQIGTIWIDVSVREHHALDAEVTDHPVEQGADISDHIRVNPETLQIDGIVTNQPLELPGSHLDGVRSDPSPIVLGVPTSTLGSRPVTIEGEPSLGDAGLIPGVGQAAAVLGALGLEVRSRRQFGTVQHPVDPHGTTRQYSALALHFSGPFDRVSLVRDALYEAINAKKLVTVVTALRPYENVALVSLSIERDRPADILQFSLQARVMRVVNSQTADPPNPADRRVQPQQSAGKQSTTPATEAETKSVLASGAGL